MHLKYSVLCMCLVMCRVQACGQRWWAEAVDMAAMRSIRGSLDEVVSKPATLSVEDLKRAEGIAKLVKVKDKNDRQEIPFPSQKGHLLPGQR